MAKKLSLFGIDNFTLSPKGLHFPSPPATKKRFLKFQVSSRHTQPIKMFFFSYKGVPKLPKVRISEVL